MRTALVIVLVIIAAFAALAGGFVAATWAPERSVEELKVRWAGPPSTFVDVDGLKVHVRDEGPRDDPSPILLMHGFGSSLHAWDGWADLLTDKRRVIRFDFAGFGLTGPAPDGRYSADNDVRLAVALLDKLGVPQAVFGGNSLGGGIAWRAAVQHPERVDKLILVDASGYQTTPLSIPIGMQIARMPGVAWVLQYTLPRILVEQGLHNTFGDPGRVTPEMIDRAVDMNQREGNRRALIERVTQRGQSAPLAQRIPELTLPTLIVWGGRDRLVPPADAERFHREIAGSTLAMFDDLGHAPEEEDPARTVVAVKAFLGVE